MGAKVKLSVFFSKKCSKYLIKRHEKEFFILKLKKAKIKNIDGLFERKIIGILLKK